MTRTMMTVPMGGPVRRPDSVRGELAGIRQHEASPSHRIWTLAGLLTPRPASLQSENPL